MILTYTLPNAVLKLQGAGLEKSGTKQDTIAQSKDIVNEAPAVAAPVTARKPKPTSVAAVDKKVLVKLAGLSDAGKLPKYPLRISITKANVVLVGASAEGEITLEANGLKKDVEFAQLGLADRATVVQALLASEPDNKGLAGLLGFYLEAAGRADLAAKYYQQAGTDMSDQVGSLFE